MNSGSPFLDGLGSGFLAATSCPRMVAASLPI